MKALKNIYKYLYNIIFYGITLAADYIKKIKIYINTTHTNYKNNKLIKE